MQTLTHLLTGSGCGFYSSIESGTGRWSGVGRSGV